MVVECLLGSDPVQGCLICGGSWSEGIIGAVGGNYIFDMILVYQFYVCRLGIRMFPHCRNEMKQPNSLI